MTEVAGEADAAPGIVSSVTSSAGGILSGLKNRAMGIVDAILPPQKRQEWSDRALSFAASNPKLTAFLLTNVALTGVPLGLFILFTITVTIFSLLAALIIGLLVAVLFILFCVGVALLVVLPTVFFTTMASTFLFLWGLGGYYVFKWFNETGPPAAKGQAIGDQLNSMTGGRMNWLMDSARGKEQGNTSIAKDMPHLDHSEPEEEATTQSKVKGGHIEKEHHAPPKLKDQHPGAKGHKAANHQLKPRGDDD